MALKKSLSILSRRQLQFNLKPHRNMALKLSKVLISDEVDQLCVTVLKDNGIEVVKNTKLTKEQLIAEIPNYDGLIVRSATKVTSDVIEAGKRLKIIGRAGTGVDNIDCNAATEHGVVVMNTPGGNTLSAAEHTCALIMATSRHISNGTQSLREERWDRKKFMGNEVYGKTLAIVGLGRIGQEVAHRMKSFGMTTIGFDPIIDKDTAAGFGVEWLSLEELWTRADYVTVHTPLIPATKNLIGKEVFNKCKKGLRVINCARGGIVDETALLEALGNGQCAGAGLDVFMEEPSPNKDLINHPLVTSTPHLGANTIEAQTRVAVEIGQQFVDAKNAKSLFGAINAHALSNALSVETKPWVDLGSSLGVIVHKIAGEISKDAKITVLTQGATLSKASSYLVAAAQVGILKSDSSNGINLVSAPALAKKLGYQFTSSHTEGATNIVTLEISQSGTTHTVQGSVAGTHVMVTSINGATFTPGALVSGDMVLYQANGDANVLANLAGTLPIQSFATSSPLDNKVWGILGTPTEPTPADVTAIKQHVEFVTTVRV